MRRGLIDLRGSDEGRVDILRNVLPSDDVVKAGPAHGRARVIRGTAEDRGAA